MRRVRPHRRPPRGAGLTLIEAVVSIVLVGIMLVAAIHTLGTAKGGQLVVRNLRDGRQLADELMDEILALPYADASVIDGLEQAILIEGKPADATLGPELGEAKGGRAAFDDVDDYQGWTESPPQSRDATELARYADYTRTVKVSFTQSNDASKAATQDEGSRLVTVVVSRHGAQVAQRQAVVTLGPKPTQACVLPDGTCLDLPVDLCAALGGTALGAGTTRLLDEPIGDNAASVLGVIAEWGMDEGSGTLIADAAGGHDGTLVGGTWTTGPKGGTGVGFTRGLLSNQYVLVPDDAALDLTDRFTITGWARFAGGTAYHPLISKGFGTALNYWVGFDASNQLLFRYGYRGAIEEVPSGLSVEPDTWSFVAVAVDDDTVTFYLDGATASATKEDPLTTNDLDPTIALGADSSEQFEGVLDDVRIYGRALTTAELSEQYADYAAAEDAAPDLVSCETAKLGTDGDHIDLPVPADVGAGDLLIAAVVADGDNAIAAPSGWTKLYESGYGNAVRFGVWWKLAGASEPGSHAFSWSGSEQAYAWMMRITGHDPDDPFAAKALRAGSGSSPSAPGVTTGVDSCLILRLGGFDDDVTVGSTGLPGHTLIVMDESNSKSATASGGAGWAVQALAGEVDAASFALTGVEQYHTMTLAVQPPSTP